MTPLILFFGVLLLGCGESNKKCNCSENEMLQFVANLNAQYSFPVNKNQIECQLVDDLWLVRLDSLDEWDADMFGHWDGLYDSQDVNFRYIQPIGLRKTDLKRLQPIIRKIRANGYNLSFIKRLEGNSKFAFEITTGDKMERIIQQRYTYEKGKWVWIKNNKVWQEGNADFRLVKLK